MCSFLISLLFSQILKPFWSLEINRDSWTIAAGYLAKHSPKEHLGQYEYESQGYLSHVVAFNTTMRHTWHESRRVKWHGGYYLSIEVAIDGVHCDHSHGSYCEVESAFHSSELPMALSKVLFLHFDHFLLLSSLRWVCLSIGVLLLQLLYLCAQVLCALNRIPILFLVINVFPPGYFDCDCLSNTNPYHQ